MAEDKKLPVVAEQGRMLAEPARLRELMLPAVDRAKAKLQLPCQVDLRPIGQGLALVIDGKDYPILHGPARIDLTDAAQVERFKEMFGAYVENAMTDHLNEGGVSPCRPLLTRRAMAILAEIEARNKRDAGV